jgi:hypothetical protein
LAYRFHSRQKTYSIGPYGNGKDGTCSLADARRERDKAKDLLKEGKDPSTEKDAPLSNNTLNKRLRLLGIDTKTDHCAHGVRTTFWTLSHHEDIKDAKARDGDVVELQLAHLDNSTVEGLYKKHGPLALIGSRTKLMPHWADRIDHWLDPTKVMPIKRGTQA